MILIISGRLNPCQIASEYCGNSVCKEPITATASIGATVNIGRVPTAKQIITNKSTGIFINLGGSWGVLGKSFVLPLKNTSWINLKE
jgi:hypothetical protein